MIAAETKLAEQLTCAGDRIWVRVGTLLDGVNASPIANAHLVYDAEAIRYVGAEPPPAEIRPSGMDAPLDLLDVTVLPGLVEAHAHLFLDGAPLDFEVRKAYLKKENTWMLDRARTRLERLVRMGVMAVRDAGDNRGVGLALRQDYAGRNGAVVPYIDSPGAAIHKKGRYGSFMAEAIELHDSPDACVDARCADGADRIKLIATGIINFKKSAVTAKPQMSAEEVAAFTDAARRNGRQSFAHASGADGVGNVVDGGVNSVEHGFFITPEHLAKMRDRQIAWVPTFIPVQAQVDNADAMGWSRKITDGLQGILDGHAESLRRAHELGVTVLAGSDAGSCGVAHGLGLIQEMERMEHAGMPSGDVICAATGKSASFLEIPDPIGRIEAGCRPRMIFTRHSPLETVANLRLDKTVVFDGRALDGAAITETDGL